jgi:hypothetical protein
MAKWRTNESKRHDHDAPDDEMWGDWDDDEYTPAWVEDEDEDDDD